MEFTAFYEEVFAIYEDLATIYEEFAAIHEAYKHIPQNLCFTYIFQCYMYSLSSM